MPRNVLIEFRRDSAANWTSADPTLASGEPGYETDTGKIKIGDGSTAWSSLPYFTGSVGTLAQVLAAGNNPDNQQIAGADDGTAIGARLSINSASPGVAGGALLEAGALGSNTGANVGTDAATTGGGGGGVLAGGAGTTGKPGGTTFLNGGSGDDGSYQGARFEAQGGTDSAHGRAAILSDNYEGYFGDVFTSDGNGYGIWAPVTGTLNFVVDGGGSTVTTGIKGDVVMPFAGVFTQVTLLADQSGDIELDIWNQTYGSYPPTVTESIVAAAPPTISSAIKSQDSTLSGWTTAFAAGDILRFNVNSVTSITRATLALDYTKQ